jgi:pyridoxal-phosphate dependent TrpB-like enzyme
MATVTGHRISLSARELPGRWLNPLADLAFQMPPMMSKTGFPMTEQELAPILPAPVIAQELETGRRHFAIPGRVRDAYLDWRPTPMLRAERLERALDTPAKLYFKFEGGSPSGSYESNTAIPQAHYIKESGSDIVVTGGAGGVWIMAMGHAASLFGLKARIYSVREPGTTRAWGEPAGRVWGVDVEPSPSEKTRVGRHRLQERGPDSGTIAVALSEAYEEATLRREVKFAMPTLLNFAAIHQSIIGQEAERQLAAVDETPDYVIGAIGAGAHFAGLIAPFVGAKAKRKDMHLVAVEEASTPSLTRGVYAYDTADSEGIMPAVQMYTVGRDYFPPGVLSGSMRYHGVAPIVSALYREKIVEAVTSTQIEAYSAGLMFTRSQGIILAPSSMYTVKEVIEQAMRCKEEGREATILFSITSSIETEKSVYDPLLDGTMQNRMVDEKALRSSITHALKHG